MSHFETLLGATLQKGTETLATSAALADKDVVGIYFSAHWCGPCRGFTPVAADAYSKLVASGKKFEIVFASSDRDAAAFKEYYAEMPWLALPFEDRDRKDELSKKYKVRGIPTLVLLDGATGELITTKGRGKMSAPEDFPWAPKSLAEMLGDEFVEAGGAKAEVRSSVVGLYFSAHWCPPCRGFTPKLAQKYEALKAAGKDLEIIFLSSDQDESAFDEYLGEMPWCALPYSKRKEKEALSEHFGVQGIPTLVWVDMETGKTINDEGRAAVMAESFIEDFPFHPKPVNDLAAGAGKLNEEPSLVVLMEGSGAAAQAAASEALEEVAGEEWKKLEAKRRAGAFFTAKGGGPTGRIRQLVGLPAVVAKHAHALAKQDEGGRWGCDGCSQMAPTPGRFRCTEGCDFDLCDSCRAKAEAGPDAADAAPVMVLLDIPDKGGFYFPAEGAEAVTVANIEAFLEAYKAKSLTRKQLGE